MSDTWGDQSEEAADSWGNQSKPSSDSWGNQSKPSSNSWGNQSKPSSDTWGKRSKPSGDSWGKQSEEADDSWGGQSKPSSDSWGNQSKPSSDSWGNQSKPSSDTWGKRSKPSGDSWGKQSEAADSWGGESKAPAITHDKKRREKSDTWGDQSEAPADTPNKTGNPPGSPAPAPYKPEEVDLEEEAKLQADGAGENFKRYKDQSVTCFPEGAVKPIDKFEDAIESKLLLENVTNLKYNEMTPIQRWAMPAIRDGYDIIGCAQTGSGKTAAFLLPILQNILKLDLQQHDPNDDCQNPYCLIISPTRELARQIYTHAKMLSKDSLVKSCVVYGQVSTAHLKAQLSNGCHILVATLGRLKDFVERKWIGFKNIKYIVLDEGDRLIDEGFKGDIAAIFENETMSPKQDRQTLFFSATFKKDIQANARNYLNEKFVFLAVGKIGASNEDIKQTFLQVARKDKKRELKNILSQVPENDKAIIFTQTKATADFLASFFTSMGLLAASIHGDRHQWQREQAISIFRKGERRFLISSPVGNRGLDLPKVALVINYDLPDNIDEYVHRIGRTGRAGHTGKAISFVDKERDMEIIPDLLKNLKDAKQEIPDWLTETSAPPQSSDDWVSGGNDNDWGDSSNQNNNGTKASQAEEDWSGSAPRKDNWSSSAPRGDSRPNHAPRNNDWSSSAPKKDDWGGSSSKNDDWGASSSKNDDWGGSSSKTDDWGAASNSAPDVKPSTSQDKTNEDEWSSTSTGQKRSAPEEHNINHTKRHDSGKRDQYDEEW